MWHFILLFSLLSIIGFGQKPLQRIEINTTEGEIPLAGRFYYMTQEGEMSPQQAMDSLKAGRFKLANYQLLNFGNSIPNVWVYMHLNNQTDTTINLVLRIENKDMLAIKWYNKHQESYNLLYRLEANSPFERQLIENRTFLFPVTLHPYEQVEYLWSIKKQLKQLYFPVELFHVTNFSKINQREYLTIGFLVGFLLFVAIFNLFLWVSIQDKVYLIYSGYILSSVLYFMAKIGIGYQYFWSFFTHIQWLFRIYFFFFLDFFFIYFTQLFTKQTIDDKWLFYANNIFKWSSLGLVFVLIFYCWSGTFFDANFPTEWDVLIDIVTVFGMVPAFFTALKKAINGDRPTQYYLLANTIFSLIIVVDALNRAAVLQVPLIFVYNLFPVGMIIEVLILSFGLTIRYNSFKQRSNDLALQLVETQNAVGKQIIRTQEAERSRLAQDLHDDLGGTLSALKGRIANESVQLETLGLIEKAINDLRIVSRNLLPIELEKEGLAQAVRYTVERLQSGSKVEFTYIVFGQEVRLSQEYELNLYRIVAELLNNVVKHAGATKAVVQVVFHAEYLYISVEDDGIGIKTEKNTWGIGLKNISSRVEFLKARLFLDSSPNKGTTVIVEVPYPF